MSVVIPQRLVWTEQPQWPVHPNRELIPTLSHLWIPCGSPRGFIDIAGGWDALNIIMADPAVGRCGVCVQGTGASSQYGERGAYTAADFGKDWCSDVSSVVTNHTVFGLVEFDLLSGSAEYSVLRVDVSTGNYMLALDVFPNTKTVRPLVKTSGTNGWNVANDMVHNEIVVNTPLIIAYRYRSGSPIASLVCPIGGKGVWTSTASAVSGGVVQLAASGNIAHIGGFGNFDIASSFPGKIYMAGMVPYAMSDAEMQSVIDNPWIVCAK